MNKKILGAVVLIVVILLIVGVYMYGSTPSSPTIGSGAVADFWSGTYVDDAHGRVPKTIIQKIDETTVSIDFNGSGAFSSAITSGNTIQGWGQIGTHDGDKKIVMKLPNGQIVNTLYKV